MELASFSITVNASFNFGLNKFIPEFRLDSRDPPQAVAAVPSSLAQIPNRRMAF